MCSRKNPTNIDSYMKLNRRTPRARNRKRFPWPDLSLESERAGPCRVDRFKFHLLFHALCVMSDDNFYRSTPML